MSWKFFRSQKAKFFLTNIVTKKRNKDKYYSIHIRCSLKVRYFKNIYYTIGNNRFEDAKKRLIRG